jgi:putative PEP-CTERM system TPR-repeat lipoprotein
MAIGFALAAVTGVAAAAGDYETALEYFETGRHAEAVIELRNVLAESPENVTARVLLGRALLGVDKPREAATELEKALALGGDENLILVPLGQVYLQLLQPEKVLTSIILPRGKDPRVDGEILLLHGDATLLLGNLKYAEQNYIEAGNLVPRDARPLIGRARIALARGRSAEAIVLLDEALTYDPDSADAWALKGTTDRDNGRIDQAERALSKALEIDADHEKALSARAALRLQRGAEEGARADLKRLRSLNPVDLEGLYLESLLLFREGKHAEAVELLHANAEILRQIDDDYRKKVPHAQLMLGIVKFFDGEYQQAGDLLKKFTGRFPDHAGARQYLAATYLNLGEWDAVVRTLAPSPGDDLTDDPATLSLLAEAYRANGYFDRATQIYKRALEISPDQVGLGIGLAESQFAAGRIDKAIADIEALIDDIPDWIDPQIVLARMYVKAGYLDKGHAVASMLVKRVPDNPRVQNLIGAVEMARGNFTAARRRFVLATEADAADLLPKLNIARLAVREGDVDAGVVSYLEVIDEYPNAADPRYEMAEVYLARGEIDAAADQLNVLLQQRPNTMRAKLGMLRVRLARNEIDKLEDAIFEVSEQFPNNPEALLQSARIYMALDDFENARLMLRRASENAQFDADTLYLVAYEQLSIGDAGAAQWSLTKALSGNQRHLGALTLTVIVRIALEKWEEADEALQTLQTLYPRRVETALAAGDLRLARSDYPGAVAAFVRAHKLAPSRATVRRLFSAQVAAGDTDAALKTIRVWILVAPDDLGSRHLLAERLTDAGELRAAQLVYEGILKYDANDPVVANNLAVIYQKRGDRRALEFAARAAETMPGDPNFMDTYGWILAENGEPERGLEILRDAYTRQSTNEEIRYHIALALLQLGRDKAAQRELNAAIASEREFPSRPRAQALLEDMDNN